LFTYMGLKRVEVDEVDAGEIRKGEKAGFGGEKVCGCIFTGL